MPFTFKDMLNLEIVLEKQPELIISLVPSQTELLYELGAGERVVGQTVFLGRMLAEKGWVSLTIPKGNSKAFNTDKFSKPKERGILRMMC